MDDLELFHLFTLISSGGGNCPAVYGTNMGDDIVIQGYDIGGAESQLHNRADNERGVRIPYELAEQIADMVNARRGQ